MVFIAFVFCTMASQALVVGTDFLSPVFEPLQEPDGILDALIGIVQAVFGGIVLIFQLLTFGVISDVPPVIRILVGAVNTVAIFLALMSMVRGN